MQELVIVSYCDRCYQTDKSKVEASDEVEVVVGEQKARLDLCDPCNRDLFDPVRALMRAREAAQRAVDKSTGAATRKSSTTARESSTAPQESSTAPQEPRAPAPKAGPLARCGQCGEAVQIRLRGQHARSHHDGAKPEDLTWHFDDVDKVWACSCGLSFPTEHGRNTHSRRIGHPLPEDTGPQTPLTTE
jgi:hypothetical protein